jgi:transcriptional regulator with XRE-family HTH domain
MHTILAISEIKDRAEAIGLTLSEIANKAGIAPSTALRMASGKTQGGWISTNKRLAAALVAEEERVRAHLAQVPRPDPDKEKTDAAA